jgi:8-oxo-dGTP diphosphatase
VEPGETHGEALERELREELGIVIAAPTGAADAIITVAEVSLSIWRCDAWSGEPCNLQPEEHDAIGWFRREELSQLTLAHPDYTELFAALVFAAGPGAST